VTCVRRASAARTGPRRRRHDRPQQGVRADAPNSMATATTTIKRRRRALPNRQHANLQPPQSSLLVSRTSSILTTVSTSSRHFCLRTQAAAEARGHPRTARYSRRVHSAGVCRSRSSPVLRSRPALSASRWDTDAPPVSSGRRRRARERGPAPPRRRAPVGRSAVDPAADTE